MTTQLYLLKQLESIQNAKRANRERVATLVLNQTELMPYLILQFFEVSNKISIKAAWTLEIVCEQKIDLLIPYLNTFTENIGHLKFESAVRPASKICNFLGIAFDSEKKENNIRQHLTEKHIDQIIEACFDWLIGNFKVATKAYAMNVLFIFGKKKDWVHEELQLILLQNIPNESAAYKARGRITLELINKK